MVIDYFFEARHRVLSNRSYIISDEVFSIWGDGSIYYIFNGNRYKIDEETNSFGVW